MIPPPQSSPQPKTLLQRRHRFYFPAPANHTLAWSAASLSAILTSAPTHSLARPVTVVRGPGKRIKISKSSILFNLTHKS